MAWTAKERRKYAPAVQEVVRQGMLARLARTMDTLDPQAKVGRQRVPFEPDFCGFSIPDKFVIGYGLDYNDEYRHLPFIGVLPDGTA